MDLEGATPTITSDAPYTQIEGVGIPSADGTTTTVRALISPADGDASPTAAGDVACTAVTDIDGNFDCEPATALLAGTYALSVTQEPSWALGTRSLLTAGGVTLIVRGPEFVIDGKTTYRLNQGDSLRMSGTLDYNGADRDPTTVITATMSIDGTKTTPFECGFDIETIRWTCALAVAPVAAGTYTVELAATSDRGLIVRDRSTTVTVIAAQPVEDPTVQAPAPTPTPPAEEPLEWTVALDGVVAGTLRPGDAFTISGANLPPDTTVDAEIQSTPMPLGSTIAGADGRFSLSTSVPLQIEPGEHTIVVTVSAPGRDPSTSRTPVTIEAAAALVDIASTTDSAAGATSAEEWWFFGASLRNEPGAPNGVSESIRPIWETLRSPVAIGSAVVAGLVFLVFAAFPAEVVAAAIKERYRFNQRRTIDRSPRFFPRARAWFETRPIIAGVVLTAAATLIAGFADPSFGFDLASVRLLIACFIAALIVSYGGFLLPSQIARRWWSVPTRIVLRPYTLIITVVGVVLSRILDFSPGFLFGLMLSLSFPAGTSAALRSHTRILRTVIVLVFSVIGWFAYSLVGAALETTEPSFGSALFGDTLAALATVGLTGMLIAMLPFLFMDGHDLWNHSKRVWAGVYAAVVVLFFLVVAPQPESWGDLGEKYGSWMLLLGCFTAASLTFYFWLRWDTRRQEQRELNNGEDRELQSH